MNKIQPFCIYRDQFVVNELPSSLRSSRIGVRVCLCVSVKPRRESGQVHRCVQLTVLRQKEEHIDPGSIWGGEEGAGGW